jgi:hypothetical protein
MPPQMDARKVCFPPLGVDYFGRLGAPLGPRGSSLLLSPHSWRGSTRQTWLSCIQQSNLAGGMVCARALCVSVCVCDGGWKPPFCPAIFSSPVFFFVCSSLLFMRSSSAATVLLPPFSLFPFGPGHRCHPAPCIPHHPITGMHSPPTPQPS